MIVIDQGRIRFDGDLQVLAEKTAPHRIIKITLVVHRRSCRARSNTVKLSPSDGLDGFSAGARHSTKEIAARLLSELPVEDIAIEEPSDRGGHSPGVRRSHDLAYRALLRAHIGMGVAYRARLTVWILSSLFPLLMMAVWLSVVDEVGPTAGWRTSDFVSYYAGGALLFHTTTSFLTWVWDADLRSGDMSFKLLKPIDPFHQYLTQEIGLRVVVLAFLLPALIVLTLAAARSDVPALASSDGWPP